MKNISKKFFLSLCFASFLMNPMFANDNLLEPNIIEINNTQKSNSVFNLANIVDGFLTEQKTIAPISEKKTSIRTDFINATNKFNQGNTRVAYDEYNALIERIDNDLLALNLAKVFYEIGFFSLADMAIDKIISKNNYEIIINDLKRSYKTGKILTQEEEIYFAKQYSNIFYNLNGEESLGELLQKKSPYLRDDYASYIISCGFYETKQLNKAQNYINKSLGINPKNIRYQIFKIDILIAQKKYAEAKTLIEKLEKDKSIILLLNDILIKKQIVLAHLSKKEFQKRYHLAYRYYLEGDFEKSKKECLSILNFDKENAPALALYAKNELALGSVERAGSYFINSYKLEGSNFDTLIGLGDVRFIHGDYKNSSKVYQKAYNKNKSNYETIIKLYNAKKEAAKNPRELTKLEQQLDKAPNSAYIDYFSSAISIAQKNSVLKEAYLKRALSVNPMLQKAIGELVSLQLKNKNYNQAQNLIYTTSFSLEKNYYYYYLLGMYNEAVNKNKEAIQFYKTSLNLNPNFETANVKLLRLIPDKIEDDSKEEI